MQANQVAQLPSYRLAVGNENLAFQELSVSDPVVTGAQILALAKILRPTDHLLFQMLPDGLLEEIRPEESTNLTGAGTERFLVFKSDRSFRFLLDDRSFDWGATHISGATLKKLAGVEALSTDVWLDTIGGTDRIIGEKELADLSSPGVERFFTKPVSITVIVNGKKRTVHSRVLAYWDVVLLAYPEAQPSEGIIYTIDYGFGPPANPEGTLAEGQKVQIKEGMKFYVTPTDKS